APGRAESASATGVVSGLSPWLPANHGPAHLTKSASWPGQLLARQSRSLRSAVLVQIVHSVLHGTDFFGVLVADLDVELFFQRHDQLDQVKRIGVQVIDEVRLWSHLFFADAQLFGDDFFQALLSAGRHRYF